ncbi:MAG: tetratricopeptide repeat protein [Rhizonema sp. PD38]|nr:tetratricopeptide repeat protein [Rhizonema sp. PD38]
MSLPPPLPDNEIGRLDALHQYQILDTPSEKVFDDFTFLAAQICRTPIALISLIDGNRQWFKSKVGLTVAETSRDVAFCAYTILHSKPLLVKNASEDPRFSTNPLVTSDPNIRFYAGAPLITPEGFEIGTLCVIDTVPRELTLEQVESLNVLSSQVMAQFELRRNVMIMSRSILQRQQAATKLRRQQEFVEIFYYRGVEKARKGDYKAAIADFNQFLQINPKGFKAYYNRGLARRHLGDLKGAMADFDTNLRYNPEDVQARYERGLVRSEFGDYKGAMADYSFAMRIKPHDAIFESEPVFPDQVDNKLNTVLNYTEVLQINPQNTEASLTAVEVEVKSEYQSESTVRYTDYNIEYQPEVVTSYTESGKVSVKNAETYISRGDTRSLLGDYDGAIEDYTECLRINPSNVKAYMNRGHARSQLKDYSGAIKDYTESLRLNPNDIEPYVSRGHIRGKLKDYIGAIEDYTEYLRLNPNNAKIYISRAIARSKLKDYNGAMEDYKRARQASTVMISATKTL